MQEDVQDQFKISPSLVFFLINSIQIGVGVLSFQSQIVKHAGYDAWISIIIAGIAVHIIIWMMYQMLNNEKSDIVSIHKKIFGKWIGSLFSLIFVVYYLFLVIIALRLYVEVIEVWMFPRLNLYLIAIIFATLLFYIVNGGFRVVTGICFLGVVIPLYLIFTLFSPLEFAHYSNLLPIMNHSLLDILRSSKEMSLSLIGFSTLFFYFPFIKHHEKSQKYAHFGVVFSISLYLLTALVSFVFYSEEQIKSYLWPTLQLWKIIEIPFVERFEYVGISSWALVILPNITLSLWAASRGVKRVLGINQRKTLIFFLLIVAGSLLLITGHSQIAKYSAFVSNIGFYLLFGYIPFLFIVYWILNKVRKKT